MLLGINNAEMVLVAERAHPRKLQHPLYCDMLAYATIVSLTVFFVWFVNSLGFECFGVRGGIDWSPEETGDGHDYKAGFTLKDFCLHCYAGQELC